MMSVRYLCVVCSPVIGEHMTLPSPHRLWRKLAESLANARVLVTGASTGIGEEMAYHYARAGAHLLLTARREDALLKVKTKCLELGAKSVSLALADMASSEAREKVMEQAITALGKVATPFTTSYGATKFALDGFFSSLRHELAMKNIPVSITLCILGLIDTQSAMEKVKDKTSLPAYPAQDAALAVVSAGASRVWEMYYPWYVRPVCFIRDWFPQGRDWMIQKSYQQTSDEKQSVPQ
ncbi:hydroxysteroid 11-beta-dehydrogenase 1-like protein isoform X3 [Rana temporaria]|uniref:hydroxysteroid 11-beta-dehydrogenase 1-like protein isoform X3 n=1 Tax=Rana temporaria TaxID=8407 RepID=UPI001AADCEAC|nr:hydroxysteroid 11-beta-dehydrogenase 1-like protein isoform X3 [Rana temporaria]